MTAQMSEVLRCEGEDVEMCTTPPLCHYFAMGGFAPRLEVNCTAVWRGYGGRWEIIAGRLYLVELQGTLEDGTEGSVASVFPDFPGRVFAHWYSGTIRIPQGELLAYIHGGSPASTSATCFWNWSVASSSRPEYATTGRPPDLPVRIFRGRRQGAGIVFGAHWLMSTHALDEADFTVKRTDLHEPLTVPQIEAREAVEDPLRTVPNVPFGHMNAAWKQFATGVAADVDL